MDHPWFFVRRLAVAEQRPGARYEVQLLDDAGRGVATARYDKETSLALSDVLVIRAVLDAGRAQPDGSGDYVDQYGNPTPPS